MPQASSITRRTALAAMAALACPRSASAQSGVPADFPKRPLTLILPLAPGGPVDTLGRLRVLRGERVLQPGVDGDGRPRR